MSMLQHNVPALIAVVYSAKRKEQLREIGLTNCSVIESIIKQVLKKNGITSFKMVYPINYDRADDLYVIFNAPSKEAIKVIADVIYEQTPSNLSEVLGYVDRFDWNGI